MCITFGNNIEHKRTNQTGSNSNDLWFFNVENDYLTCSKTT